MKVDIYTTDKKYNIIYADPPWAYRQNGSKTHIRGMAKQHYQTMTTEDICDLPIRNIATDDCICFMWATFPNIGEALKVMDAWGFEYKTAGFVWIKKNKKKRYKFLGNGSLYQSKRRSMLIGNK